MGNIDANVIMIGIFLLTLILIGAIIWLVHLFSASRQISRARLDKLHRRFGPRTSEKGQTKSVFIEAAKVTTLEQLVQNMLPNIDVIKTRLARTGRKLTLRHYGIMTAVSGIIAFAVLKLFFGVFWLLALLLAVFIGLILPHMIINAMIKKRLKNFITLFPDALDLLVRGLRSGLPITESMSNVAREVDEPIGSEFRWIMDQVRIGKGLEESLERAATRLDTPEFKFFVISLSIQRETGGNLAETLAKLSDLLRRRQQMRLKIKAMASEGKASAYIVGALPFVMFTMLLMINYDYTSVLFTDTRAIYTALGGLVWMSIGAFIMKQMISFEI